MMRFPRPSGQRGFTLVEILVVITIIALISAVALPVVLPALNERRVSEAARIFQAVLVGTRDAAIRANAPRGVRLLPDPVLSPAPYGNTANGILTSNRFVAIEPAPDYSEGMIVTVPTSFITVNGTLTSKNGFLQVLQAQFTNVSGALVPNEPSGWAYNIRQGDRIRFNDSGAFYTVAGPMQAGPSNLNLNPQAAQNTERYVNDIRVLKLYSSSNTTALMTAGIPFTTVNGSVDLRYGPEYLNLVNGFDDDGDGWIDEGFDGIDNDGDGITDPGFNGVDDNKDGVIDDPAELRLNNEGEYEPEAFIGDPPNSVTALSVAATPANTANPLGYTIVRRPIVSPNARETTLPEGIVIDMTTWNSASATPWSTLSNPNGTYNGLPIQFPERSRVPVDPYSFYVDIMVAPSGQVVQAGAGSAGIEGAGTAPTSNIPFFHFWLTERVGVVPPLNGFISPPNFPNIFIPRLNLNYPSQTYLLPMPQGTTNLTGSNPGSLLYSGPPLKGERRLVTLFTRTGQVVTNSIEEFDLLDTNRPYYAAQSGIKESQ